MQRVLRRRPSLLHAACPALAAMLVVVLVGVPAGGVSSALGQATVTNACLANTTATYTDLQWTLSGHATPSTTTLGSGQVTAVDGAVNVTIPSALLVAGYDFGLLEDGPNVVPVNVWVARQATNVDIGGGVRGTKVRVDRVSINATTVITDPDGVRSSGDESSSALAIDEPLPDFTVVPLGGDVVFSQAAGHSIPTLPAGPAGNDSTQPAGSLFASVALADGSVHVNFDCSPGTTIPTSGVADTPGTAFTPAPPTPFETVAVATPPSPPTCTAEAATVLLGQPVRIDLTDNCTDVNDSAGGAGPLVFTVGTPSLGSLVATSAAGVYTYTAPAIDPGGSVTIPFTATDTSGLVSASQDISITILDTNCDAATTPCDLSEVVVQAVTGSVMTMDTVTDQVALTPLVLNGKAQVATGAIHPITITNARGSAAGWTITAYATDFGAVGAPTFSPLPGVTVPVCSNAGAGPSIADPDVAAAVNSDRLCIPGDNLGWSPVATVAHDPIPGDVAQILAGSPSASSPEGWLAALVAAGNRNDPGVGVDGLGGLRGARTLCSAPVNHSGGIFTCNATLFLGVPASSAAGVYSGSLVLTLT